VFIVVDGSWDHEAFLSEIEIFPDGEHDDQVDAVSGAFNYLSKMSSSAPVGIGATTEYLKQENYWAPMAMVWGFDTAGGYEGQRIVNQRLDEPREPTRQERNQLIADAMAIFSV
jgi:hypothetical protein